MKLEEVLSRIDVIEYAGNKDLEVERVISLDHINKQYNAISWCSDKNIDALQKVDTSSAIIISQNAYASITSKLNLIVVENPRRTFQKILKEFFIEKRELEICKTSIIDDSVVLGKNVTIGHNVVVEKDCFIGNNTIILHNTVICHGTKIGNNVTIGCNNTIGGIGFGYEKNAEGDFELMPHIGNVVIGDNVDIGNNTCIDRAVLGSTILDDNVKVDNLVHIAHGVKVGRNSVVIANAMVAGSVKIGENSWIAPSSSILNKRNVGDNALVGMGAVVTKNVEDKTIVAGNPSKFIRSID